MTTEQERGLRLWYDLCKNNCELVEIRAFDPMTGKVYSGYFDNVDNIIEALRPYEHCNVYWTLNKISDSCFSRLQHNRMLPKPKETTSDNDIIGYEFILCDLDCERSSGVASSEEELTYAKKKANEVYAFLRNANFSEPMVCCSGSGIHLLYKVKLQNNAERQKLVKDFLDALGMLFSDDKVKIDGVVGNPSRICRLPYFVNRKGADTQERPHRMAYIVKAPETLKSTDINYIEQVASLIPKPETPSRQNHYQSADKFDIEDFIKAHGIQIAKRVKTPQCEKLVLAECPFNNNHKAPDSALFVFPNNAIAFRCLHASCSHYTFRDFRLHFDPHAYDRSTYNEYVHKRNYYGQYQRPAFVPQPETQEKGPKWKKLGTVKKAEISMDNYIVSGFMALDAAMCGFRRKHISIWSGMRGSAKSTIINMLILNAAQRGFKSALWTGELDDSEVKTWLYLQAAGKAFNKPSKFNNYYYTPAPIVEKIDKWIDQYFDLYEQEYGENYLQIENDIRELHAKDPHDQYFLDNLMTLDLSDLDGDKYEVQKEMVRRLTKLAKELNCHIHLICHPNKSLGFLRPNSISGSGNMPDLAQNIFIAHRINRDFETSASEFLTKQAMDEIMSSGCTNVIEICKCRDKGAAVGEFIKLWFEIESNRLKSDPFEIINYNWQETPMQQAFTDLPTYETDNVFLSSSDDEAPF